MQKHKRARPEPDEGSSESESDSSSDDSEEDRRRSKKRREKKHKKKKDSKKDSKKTKLKKAKKESRDDKVCSLLYDVYGPGDQTQAAFGFEKSAPSEFLGEHLVRTSAAPEVFVE